MTLLMFLGGYCSLAENRSAFLGFQWLLPLLYLVDVVWILLQRLLQGLSTRWRRPRIPIKWAYLNTVMVLLMVAPAAAVAFISHSWPRAGILDATGKSVYTGYVLAFWALLSLAGFWYDLRSVDQYHVIG